MYAASALAANTVARSACGAAAPLFTSYMFDALGVGGGGSLIGGVATILAIIPFLFYRYGKPIRERSKFAPTPQKEEEHHEEVASSGSSTEVEEELALDEEMGVMTERRAEKDAEKESAAASRTGSDADPYLNADGMEKAEAPARI